ncbi:MAG TPA: phospholipase D-like domain-containing protein [Terrimicrobiaceae bacterium]
MPAADLIKKYCADPGKQILHPGETVPVQNTLAKMENHKAKAFVDGVAYFTEIRDDIQSLITSTAPDRFFYLTAWWLGLTPYSGTLRIDDKWDFPAQFDEFTLPRSPSPLGKRLQKMVDMGVVVRILPWVLPFVTVEEVQDATGIGGVNFHTLLSVSQLRKDIGEENVVLNLLSHTFGGAHCKMIVCGDKNSMRAYTSGLDPADGRLNPPGLSKDKVAASIIRSYSALTQAEADQIANDLQQNILSQQLYDKLREWNAPLPDYGNFATDLQSGKYWYQIQVRWDEREWKLTFVEQVANDQYDVDIVYIKREKWLFHLVVWPSAGWHDVGVKVEGRAAGALHDFFKAMWDEQLTRPVEAFTINGEKIVSHSRHCQPLQARQAIDLAPNTGAQCVQVLRTIPKMNFTLTARERGNLLVPDTFRPIKFGIRGHRIKIGKRELAIPAGAFAGIQSAYNRQPLSFAPDGCFEFKVALKQAISAAEEYIFIADQALYALEVMDWISARISHKPNLKVIFLFGADPADPPNDFLSEAMNEHLLKPLWISRNQVDKQPTHVVFYEWTGNAVHCKVTIIDDVWCAIGSANCMRRSLYTDIELSVAILEPKTDSDSLPRSAVEEANPAAHGKVAPSFVQRFRRDLWAHYCGISLDVNERSEKQSASYTELLSLRQALQPWNPVHWRALLKYPVSLRPEISRQNLNPFPTSGVFKQMDYDRKDPDSRKPF